MKKTIFWFIVWMLTIVFVGYMATHQSEIISPLPNTGFYLRTTVYADESDHPAYSETWEDVSKEIIEVFSIEGKQATEWALRCFYSESGWREEAYNFNSNETDDRGIAQINSVHGYSGDLHDYKYNIRKALEIYQRDGSVAWYGSQCD